MNTGAIETCKGLKFYYRLGTTDEKVIPEVVGRNNYFRRGFLEPSPGELWADLGGNIGTFSILVASKGCKSIAFEPEPSNVEYFKRNVELNGFQDDIDIHGVGVTDDGGKRMLFLSNGRNKYRHTLVRPIRGRRSIYVETIPLADVLSMGVTAVKMDIEGAELDIFDNTEDWGAVNKLTFEYHFDFDRSIPRFYKRMEKLKAHFPSIYYGKMPDAKTYDYYPAAKTVFCTRGS